MTRASAEQQKHTPWFAQAGAASSIVPIARFIGPHAFATKAGDYGVVFSVAGIDPESLTDQELEAKVRGLESALRGLPEGFCLYQYTRVKQGYEIPRQARYSNLVTEQFVDDRLSAKDLAAILGVKPKTVYRGASLKQIPSYRVCGAIKFDPKAVGYWLRKQHPSFAAAGRAVQG